MPKYDIDIIIHEDGWHHYIPDIRDYTQTIISKALDAALKANKRAEVSVMLTHDSFIRELNKKYRNKDAPTNVLSFPQSDEKSLKSPIPFISLGDIVLAYETISREAKEQDKPIMDHMAHLLVHGCLHLLHYDHDNDEAAEKMEQLEIEILKSMELKNPYESI
ncbi:MAG: rRNA maturation RNase YbeY [Alphaproteobacteria bacterium]|nr:rRNA maturation RNase YbeY [Alphaproteobacteria bacterium]